MRAVTTDTKVLVSRLGPAAVKALELAIGLTMRSGGVEITADHLIRTLLDLPDCDFCVAMSAAGIARVDVAARLDWHLKRLPGGHKGKPIFSSGLCLMLQDAVALTSDRVRTGHIAAALLADPSLSAADIAAPLRTLPREPRHLQASRFEDQGEVGRIAGAPATAAAPKPAEATPATAAPATATPEPAEVAAPPAAAPPRAAPVEVAATPRGALTNAGLLRARFADRLVSADEGGLTLTARVGGRDTTLRLAWDTEARVLVLRIALPADPPEDEVSASIALSTLNNALPHGAFVLDEGRLAFRTHVFLDAEGNAPIEAVAFAAGLCEQAADALGGSEG